MRKSESLTVTCQGCGATFVTSAQQVAKGRGKYCSSVCYHTGRTGKPRGAYKAPDERACAACGTIFLVGGRGNRGRRQRFCSEECQRRARYRHGAVAHLLTDTQSAYIAGFLDGEGSIMVINHRGVAHLVLSATNGDRGVLDWLAATTGVGAVSAHRQATAKHRATWFWKCSAEAVESVLRQIRPYLRVKGAQADLALAVQARLREPAQKADRTWQQEVIAQMQALNKRGPREEPG